MKLTVVFLLLGLLSANAFVYSQDLKIDFSHKSFTVGEVLATIEKNSEYRFLYRNDQIDLNRTIKLDPSNKTINSILTSVFNKTGVNFKTVENNLVILSPVVQQQKLRVTGKVTDQDGQSLVGVTVLIKGTTRAVVTSANGSYSIPLNENDKVLVFSFIGMKKQEVSIDGRSMINLVMETESNALNEVIVIGYGTAKRKDFTGSVASVKMEGSPVALLPNLNALEALKGNVTGLNIGATNTAGGEPTMQIRGQRSISGSNDPLIILDGVIYLGSISDINPNDIASYDVLKDAVSAAAYGSRSANGVIAITTKKGRTGKPVITFNTTTGYQTWQNRPVMMKGAEWITVVNARNKYADGATNWLQAGELANLNAGNETVWLDKVTQLGVTQDYQVAISGAAEKVNYYLSSSFNDNKGIVVGDNFNRISLFGKLNTKVTSWLELGVDANYSKRDYSGNAANIGSAQTMSPYGVMFRDDKGNLEKYPYTQSLISPLWGVNDGTTSNTDIRNSFRLNTYAVVNIPWVKGLSYRVNLLSNLEQNQSGNFTNEKYYVKEGAGLARYDPSVVQGFLSSANGNIDNSTTKSYVFDNILNYKNTFGKHNIDVTLVATRDYRKWEDVNGTGSDFGANGNTVLGMWGLSKATIQKVVLNSDERSNIGYLGRLSYAFNDKYFLTGSYRRDGASVFGADKRWGNFAAVGGAWRISNEEFLKNFEPLNSLKFKLSWGQNGNQSLPVYGTLSTVLNSAAGDARYEFSNAPGAINYGLIQSTLGNPALGWETTEAINTGFESAWLKNRLFVDVDVYSSKTTDQIFVRNIPIMTGFKTMLASLGEVDNKGIEVTVRTVNLKSKDWNWSTALTYWKNDNKLVHLYGEDKNGDGKEDDDIANNFFIGKSLGAIYGYEQDGIVQATDATYIALTGAAPGAPKYKDIDGVPGITSADRMILGYAKENFRLNLSNTASYKNFELYVMITGTFGGNHCYLKSNPYAYMTSGTGRFNDNMTYKPYWTPTNMSNEYPSAYFAGDGRFLGLQSRGFVRLQDLSLSYSLDSKWIKLAHINSMKLFISAKNLSTSTNWFGGDPETGTTVTANTYPVATTYSFGANISF